MAAVAKKDVKDAKETKALSYAWSGRDKSGKLVRGELRASGEGHVAATLRRQGIVVSSVKRVREPRGQKITEKDIAIFTRQLAVMLKAGVALLQTFDIVARGHGNPAVSRLLLSVRNEVETGSSLAQAFRKHPVQFDALYCNLVWAGEQAGTLDTVLDRLASYKEKIVAIKGKIKSALFYPAAVVVVALAITAVIMIFVIPTFKDLFKSFGADLPAPTLVVIAMSDFMVAYWYVLLGTLAGGAWSLAHFYRRSAALQQRIDRLVLRLPVFGEILRKAAIARWCRTLSTMFAAGVPLVESLDSVAGATGNHVYFEGTKKIQTEVATGSSLALSMQNTGLFPNMVLQMTAIGEESGSLDTMLSKVADFFEAEVDDAVGALSSLLEPVIMVVLGTLIAGMVIAMYLPIFKIGQVV